MPVAGVDLLVDVSRGREILERLFEVALVEGRFAERFQHGGTAPVVCAIGFDACIYDVAQNLDRLVVAPLMQQEIREVRLGDQRQIGVGAGASLP